ncbi:MAG: ABC transporter ATP-binding protein, partial [Lewinella sp.]
GMFGLLGPNGAGKSTLMRTIATLQPADSGSIRFGGLDVLLQQHEVREVLGYLPQAFGLYPTISGERLLDHLAILKGLTNKTQRREVVSGLLQKTNLYDHRKKKLSNYSGGMKQRFGIAQALLGNPSLLIVDEPTAGLDPTERNRFYNLLSALGENRVVILSTHIVEDVKELCPQMAIIHQGRVLLRGNPIHTIDSLRGKIFRKFVNRENLEAYHQEYAVIAERRLQGKPLIHIYRDASPGDGFEPVEADLNDVYFTQLLGAG